MKRVREFLALLTFNVEEIYREYGGLNASAESQQITALNSRQWTSLRHRAVDMNDHPDILQTRQQREPTSLRTLDNQEALLGRQPYRIRFSVASLGANSTAITSSTEPAELRLNSSKVLQL